MKPTKGRWQIRATDAELTEVLPPTPIVLESRPGVGADTQGFFFGPWQFSLREGHELAWLGVFDCQRPIHLTLEWVNGTGLPPLPPGWSGVEMSWVFNNAQVTPVPGSILSQEADCYLPTFAVEYDSAVSETSNGNAIFGRMMR